MNIVLIAKKKKEVTNIEMKIQKEHANKLKGKNLKVLR